MNETKQQYILYHAVAFLVVTIWGSTFVFTKLLLLGGFTPAQIFTLRFIIAYVMLLVFCLWRGIRWVADTWKDELLIEYILLFCLVHSGCKGTNFSEDILAERK